MKRRAPFVATLIAGMCLGVSHGHHSPASYDVTVTDFAVAGTIKSVAFRNPHSKIVLQAPDEDGKVVEWEVEFSSVNLLVRRGWKFDRIKPGETVTCIGNPAKAGTPAMYMWSIKLADGTVFAK